MTIVQSDDYPVAARAIKNLFRFTSHAATSPAVFPPRNFMLQSCQARLTKNLRQRKVSSSSCYSISVVTLTLINVDYKCPPSHPIKRHAFSPESTSPSLSRTICRPCVDDLRLGQTTRTTPIFVHLKYGFGSCQRSLHLICFKEILPQESHLPQE